jgi:hypothetical protein
LDAFSLLLPVILFFLYVALNSFLIQVKEVRNERKIYFWGVPPKIEDRKGRFLLLGIPQCRRAALQDHRN